MTVQKLIRDGKVAVVYSPGFGAGWSTWSTDHAETLMFDCRIAEAVLSGNLLEAARIARGLCHDMYMPHSLSLAIEWVPVGARFMVSEYDGAEGVEVCEEMNWFTA